MNTLVDTLVTQSSFISNSKRLLIILNENWSRQDFVRLIAALALRGPAAVLAGSDWVPGYGLAYEIRRQTVKVKRVLDRLQLARGFTCYQMLDLLVNMGDEPSPLLVLDLLQTFYDPDIPLTVRLRMLRQSASHLQRLSLSRPVAVIIRLISGSDFDRFLPILNAAADGMLKAIPAPDSGSQPVLFQVR